MDVVKKNIHHLQLVGYKKRKQQDYLQQEAKESFASLDLSKITKFILKIIMY